MARRACNLGGRKNEIHLHCIRHYQHEPNTDGEILHSGAHTMRRGYIALFEPLRARGQSVTRLPVWDVGGGAKTCGGMEQ